MRRPLSLCVLFFLAACGVALPAIPSPPPRPTHTPFVTRTAPAAASPTARASLTPRASATSATLPMTATATLAATVVETGTLVPGFSLTTYGRVPSPTTLTFGPDGKLYVASAHGVVYVLADADGDHQAEQPAVYVSDVEVPLGLAWVGQRLYISYRGSVQYVADTNRNGTVDQTQVIVDDLPSFGLHQNDGLALGADGFLYMGMGSTCDHCQERDPRNGTILRFKPDGSQFGIYASGLRNPFDVAFNAAGDLFATDNSRDDLGPDLPPEELNHIRAGQHYGWPECWLGNEAPVCAGRLNPVAAFTAHTSADGLTFYNGEQFPAEYSDNAFIAVIGSIYMFPEDTERGVLRVRLTPQGTSYISQTEWFLKLPEGRPVDVTVGPDGGLYVADYGEGTIYRIVYGAP